MIRPVVRQALKAASSETPDSMASRLEMHGEAWVRRLIADVGPSCIELQPGIKCVKDHRPGSTVPEWPALAVNVRRARPKREATCIVAFCPGPKIVTLMPLASVPDKTDWE